MKAHTPVHTALGFCITMLLGAQTFAEPQVDTEPNGTKDTSGDTEEMISPNAAAPKDASPAPETETAEATAPDISSERAPETVQLAPAAPLPQPESTEPPPETPSPPEQKKPKLQLSTEDGNFAASPLLLVQPIWVIPIDGETEYKAAGSGVMMKRARLGVDATLFKIATVKLWGDFRNGAPELVDAYVDVDPLKGNLVIRCGFFRPFFGRQRLNSTAKYQLVEAAQAWSDRQLGLNLNRDLGIAFSGMAADVFEWGIGLFNGEKSFSLNENRDFGMAARFAVHPLSATGVGETLKPGDETAVKMNEKPALSIGSAVSFESRRDRAVIVDDTDESLPYEDLQLKVGGEAAFQWSRLSMTSELFWMKTVLNDGVGGEVETLIDGMTPSASVRGVGMGAYFQIGVMAAKILELAGRFDWVDEHLDTDGARFYPAFGTNIYIRSHNLKLQAFYRANIATGYDTAHPNYSDRATHLLELMLQAGF